MLVVDIGANVGDLGKDLVTKLPQVHYLGVEPNYLVCEDSLNKLSREFPKSFDYLIAAVAEADGRGILHSPRTLNGQVASLLKINQVGDWNEEVAANFRGLEFEDSITVETISVPSLVKRYNLKLIDFLKIDAQGMDLRVLSQFLEHCEIRVAVVEIEITSDSQESHYLGSNNSIADFFDLVRIHGFQIMRMMPASSDCSEYNIFIAKTYIDYREVNSIIDFQSLRIFSRFWKVLGIGNQLGVNSTELHLTFLRKLISSLKHPLSSYRSLVIKLTS